MNKTQLRSQMKALRAALTPNQVQEKSRAIHALLLREPAFQSARLVCTYLSAFQEPDTLELINTLRSAGKQVAVPITHLSTHTLTLSLVEQEEVLKPGAYGIPEPEFLRPVSFSAPDFILVPGLAFDRRGNRAGFGAGYYDSFLCRSTGVKAALCYDFQLADAVPSQSHDIPMDLIITESKVIRCEKL